MRVVQIRGQTDPLRGYSALRFVPGTEDRHIIATKTVGGARTHALRAPSHAHIC